MKNKLKVIMTWLAAAVFVLALAINVKVTLDDPFVMINDMAIASGSSSSTSAVKTKYCRPVKCTGTWEGTADAEGCIVFFGKKRCIYTAGLEISFTYFGTKENCTGGSEWYDCDACQSDCVGTPDPD